jgi:peptidoglycan LD-endopeptidase CwlK
MRRDPITTNRIKLLHPELIPLVSKCYDRIVKDLTGNAICRFTSTYRSYAEQDALFAQGRTRLFDAKGNRLGVVTNARGGQSYHNFGLAIDFCLLIRTPTSNGRFVQASWNTRNDFDADGVPDWMEIVKIFKDAGFEWGGDFKSIKDMPHVQFTYGHSVTILRERLQKGMTVANNPLYPRL